MSVTLLHLSDIHRTPDEKASNAEILIWLLADLERGLANDGIPRPDLIVVSGDIAQSGDADEYKEALELVDRIASSLHLDRSHVVVVPGNHDVHWPTCEDIFRIRLTKADPEELCVAQKTGHFFVPTSESSYQSRLDHFRRFYQQLSGECYPTERHKSVTVHRFQELGIAFAGFSSLDLNDNHRFLGRIHPEAIYSAQTELSSFDGYRVALWHHDLSWGTSSGDDFLDAKSALELSAQTFDLGLCGHTHRSTNHNVAQLAGSTEAPQLPVITAGSLCAGARQRWESTPRFYNVVRLEGSVARVFEREKESIRAAWKARTHKVNGEFVPYFDVTLPRFEARSPRAGQSISRQKPEILLEVKHRLQQIRRSLGKAPGRIHGSLCGGDLAASVVSDLRVQSLIGLITLGWGEQVLDSITPQIDILESSSGPDYTSRDVVERGDTACVTLLLRLGFGN